MTRRKKSFDLFGSIFDTGAKVAKAISKGNACQKREEEKRRIKAEKERQKLQEYYKMQDMIKQGYVFMSQNQLRKYFSIMEGELFTDYLLASPSSKIPVKQSQIDAWENELKLKREYEKKLKQCATLNNKGIVFEKEGKIKSAIDTYEKNIISDYPALHSFNRLMILYRKEKKYEDEIRVIERAFEVFTESSHSVCISKWQDRLEKANKLLAK